MELFGDDRLLLVRAQDRGRKVQKDGDGELVGLGRDSVAEADIDLQRDSGGAEVRLEFDADAAVYVVLADRRSAHAVKVERQALITDIERAELAKYLRKLSR